MRDPDRSQGSVLIPTRVYEPTEKAPPVGWACHLRQMPNAGKDFPKRVFVLAEVKSNPNRRTRSRVDRRAKAPPEIQEPWVVDREQLT